MDGAVWMDRCHQNLLHHPAQQVAEGDPDPKLHRSFVDATHAYVRAYNPPAPGTLEVKVLDGSDGRVIPFTLKRTDTVMQLKKNLKEHLKKSQDEMFRLNLIYNGVEVSRLSTMAELRVVPQAVFISVQKCHGG